MLLLVNDSEKIDSKTVYSHDGHDHVVDGDHTDEAKVSVHASHKHKHKKSCGHSSRKVDGKTEYKHGKHWHHSHGDHTHESHK